MLWCIDLRADTGGYFCKKGAKLIRKALEKGINFIDTAEVYQTYPHIKKP